MFQLKIFVSKEHFYLTFYGFYFFTLNVSLLLILGLVPCFESKSIVLIFLSFTDILSCPLSQAEMDSVSGTDTGPFRE